MPQTIHVLFIAGKKSEAWAGIKYAPMPFCVCMHGMSLTISHTTHATLAFPGWEQRNVSKDVVRAGHRKIPRTQIPHRKKMFFFPCIRP